MLAVKQTGELKQLYIMFLQIKIAVNLITLNSVSVLCVVDLARLFFFFNIYNN